MEAAANLHSIVLSREQSAALDAISRWKSSGDPQFILGGFAGTGKTTLLQHFINSESKQILCLAPTGKAASVLRKKLANAAVNTVHSALYVPVVTPRTRLKALELELSRYPDDPRVQEAVRKERERLLRNSLKFSPKSDLKIVRGQLVVVDEASMVTRAMRNDLLATEARILYVGDPGQLPPVMDQGFFHEARPDAMLQEVQRQALDSPIIRLSMSIRAGDVGVDFDEPGCRRMPREEADPKIWLECDQVLTGSNAARRRLNRYFRRTQGHDGSFPKTGEKLVCLKNYRDDSIQLVNGGLARAASDAFTHDDRTVWVDLSTDDDVLPGTACAGFHFRANYESGILPDEFEPDEIVQHFDYGYALTVHKAQGSEWDRVVLADDGMRRNDVEFRRRWLYTAVTRAKKELLWLH